MNAKSIVLVLLLFTTALILRVRGNADHIPVAAPLELLSNTVGPWHGMEIAIPQDELEILGDGKFLNRVYKSDAGPSLDLLIAYFPSQRSGDSIHSPQNCLPGAGWEFESSGRINLTNKPGSRHQVGRYVVANGEARYLVLYWYRSQGKDLAGDYAAKAHLLLQSIRDGRTDGALIRIMTLIAPGESADSAQRRAVGFASDLEPMLEPYLPS